MFIPEIYTEYSLQEGFCHILDLVQFADYMNLPGVCISDIHSLSGSVEFLQSLDKINAKRKEKIKGVLGCTYRYFVNDVSFKYVTCLAKNFDGYINLVKILNSSVYKDFIPQVYYKNLLDYQDNLIFIFHEDEPLINVKNKYIRGKDLKYQPAYYIKKQDQILQQILLCSKFKITLEESKKVINDKYKEYAKFFDINSDFSLENSFSCENSLKLLDQIESFSIQKKPQIPCLVKDDPDQVLLESCRKGWIENKLNDKIGNNEKLKQIYVNRIKEELDVFREAKLANYFLIIKDIAEFAKRNNEFIGLRGSSVGCLVSYLIGASSVDPIIPDPILGYAPERELLFSRFYSKYRNTATNISLPDIDVDLPNTFREKLIEYIRDKYGHDKVSNIITFSRLDGRGVIKEVFRILQPVDNYFDVSDAITKKMVDTAKVQDDLEDLKENNPKYNIINFNLDYIPEVQSFYSDYKECFDIAVKLANTIKNTSKHAAGIIIANESLKNILPLKYDETTNEPIVAYEMADAEYCGAVKYDLLGVAAYEKIGQIEHIINNDKDTL